MIYKSSCNSCGGKIHFDPKTQKMICEYCHNTQEVKISTQIKDKKEENLDLYTCPSCGAKLVSESNEITTFCVYCKNNAILMNKLTKEFHPDGIIPFKKTKEEAIQAFMNLNEGKKLIPDDFLKASNIEEIRGVYIPFWLLDIKVTATMKAKTKTTKIIDEPGQELYVERIKKFESERQGDISYKQVPVDGSTHFEDSIMQNIEPFDYSEIKPYSSDYLAGFLAEVYDLSGDVILDNANSRIQKSSYEIFRKSMIGGTPTEIEVIDFDYKSEKTNEKYVLLPVYLLNVKHNNQYYTFAMNGQTGKIMGNVPSSKAKEVFYFFLFFIIALFCLSIIGFLTFERGFTISDIYIWLSLIVIAFIIACLFLRLEKNKLKLIEKDPEIKKYSDDLIIEKRNSKLVNEEVVSHDVSRASNITVAATLGLGIISASKRR